MTIAAPNLFAVCDEYGVPRDTPFPSGFYGKPGMPASGPFSLLQCVGLSNTAFNPDGGGISNEAFGSVSATITCTTPALWTYSGGAGAGTSVSVGSGSTANSITFTVNANGISGQRRGQWTARGEAAGVVRDFSIDLFADGDA